MIGLPTTQGKNAPGGAKHYIVDGKMTKGFAFVASMKKYDPDSTWRKAEETSEATAREPKAK